MLSYLVLIVNVAPSKLWLKIKFMIKFMNRIQDDFVLSFEAEKHLIGANF